MTRDDILRLADKHATLTAGWMFSVPDMEDFYKHAYEAGVAAEREACAKVCEKEQFELTQDVAGKNGLQHFDAGCRSCAEMIRARGE